MLNKFKMSEACNMLPLVIFTSTYVWDPFPDLAQRLKSLKTKSRVSNQNGVSPLSIMLEIHRSGQEPFEMSVHMDKVKEKAHFHPFSRLLTHKGSRPERYISSMLYSQDIPFRSGTLYMHVHKHLQNSQTLDSKE